MPKKEKNNNEFTSTKNTRDNQEELALLCDDLSLLFRFSPKPINGGKRERERKNTLINSLFAHRKKFPTRFSIDSIVRQDASHYFGQFGSRWRMGGEICIETYTRF